MVGFICVSAENSEVYAKEHSDYICTGRNDERTIQLAIDECMRENKNLWFFNGIYHIDGFYDFGDGGPATALRFPNGHRELLLKGQNLEYGCQRRYDNGVVFYVSAEALESIPPQSTADVMRSQWSPKGIQNGASLNINDVVIILANNQHPIRCIDLRRTDRVEVKNVVLISYGDDIAPDSAVGLNVAAKIPAEGCIGLTMTDGSNYTHSNYINVQAIGFYEGIQVGGEHVVCMNCGGSMGVYGFTFGNYESNCGSNHPITLINCLDERNIHLPFFGRWCGDTARDGKRLVGGQEVTMISFNIERVAKHTPGGALGDCMREEIPGTWRGKVEYTAQTDWCSTNTSAFKLWESDGSGSGFVTRNVCHKAICGSAERMSYYPSLGQQVFDTDLNKMLVCIDPENRVWVDFLGNKV